MRFLFCENPWLSWALKFRHDKGKRRLGVRPSVSGLVLHSSSLCCSLSSKARSWLSPSHFSRALLFHNSHPSSLSPKACFKPKKRSASVSLSAASHSGPVAK